jgi:hypothetical protein
MMTFDMHRRNFLAGATVVAVPLLPSSSAWSQSGAAWRFYRSRTDRPEPVYTTASMTTRAVSNVEMDANGRLPQLYLDSKIEYRAVLSDAYGTVLAVLDPLPRSSPQGGKPCVDDRIVVSGAVGDGRLHPLSERFSSLLEARNVFPNALDLSESLCGAAIQSAINQAERRGSKIQGGANVFIPAGRYPLSRPLTLPNNVTLEGEGPGHTFIDNQNAPIDAPLIVNANPVTASLSLRGLSLHGGSHGIKITVSGYIETMLIERVSIQLQSDKNVECNKLLQMSTFRDCIFGLSPFGVYVASWTSNVIAFENCSFENHTRTHLYLRGAECVTVRGGRFEGGGTASGSQATIDIEDAAATNFISVYFENTHKVLLLERKSRNSVSFIGCHFSGATGATGLIPYTFDSDGIVTFGTNDWGLITQAPKRVSLQGINEKLITVGRVYAFRSATQHHIRSERVDVSRGAMRDLLSMRPEGTPMAAMRLSGRLTVDITRTHAGQTAEVDVHRYTVSATTTGMATALDVVPEAKAAPALAVRSDPAEGATVSIALPPTAPGMSTSLQWTFEGTVSGTDQKGHLHVDLA